MRDARDGGEDQRRREQQPRTLHQTPSPRERCHQRVGDRPHRPAGALRGAPDAAVGVVLGDALLGHQQALRALDDLAALERLLQRARLGAHGLQLGEAPAGGVHRGEQLLAPERLDDVAEDAGLDRALDELLLGEGRHDHDRHRALREQALGGLDPVELGHLDVHHDQVGLELDGEADRLLAVLGLADDLVAGVLERRTQVETDDRLVFADQHAHLVTLLEWEANRRAHPWCGVGELQASGEIGLHERSCDREPLPTGFTGYGSRAGTCVGHGELRERAVALQNDMPDSAAVLHGVGVQLAVDQCERGCAIGS